MPKSRHKRKGKSRPSSGHRRPVFTYKGRRYTGVATLPPHCHPDRLEERYGDDNISKSLEVIRSTLGDDLADDLEATGVTPGDELALVELMAQLAVYYKTHQYSPGRRDSG